MTTNIQPSLLPAEDPAVRRPPRVDHILADYRVIEAVNRLGPSLVKAAIATRLDECRQGRLSPADVIPAVIAALPHTATRLQRVINATGVLVHTNLGRAPLSSAAVEAIVSVSGAADVEMDLASGRRSPRGLSSRSALAARVPDADDVHVVNNGAAALALVTVALAGGRSIVISRGEMVEIGDGFRIPELITSVGGNLVEVGATNRARLEDYAAAIDDTTAFVLKVHPSNFRIEGFTSSVEVDQLATLGVPVVVDIGSGLLKPHPRLPDEPDATTVLRAGASLVVASGDKLLGGPQCGLLLGDSELIRRLRRNPFSRAVRVDKLTLAALEATLTGPEAPVMEYLGREPDALFARAQAMVGIVGTDLAAAVRTVGRVGGGGAPGVALPSAAVSLPQDFAHSLRTGHPPVVGRVHKGCLLLDLLTVPTELDSVIAERVLEVAAKNET